MSRRKKTSQPPLAPPDALWDGRSMNYLDGLLDGHRTAAERPGDSWPPPPDVWWDRRSINYLERLWNKRRTADYLGISTKTLDRWMATGRGPAACKIGAQVRYVPADVIRFVESCRAPGGGEAA